MTDDFLDRFIDEQRLPDCFRRAVAGLHAPLAGRIGDFVEASGAPRLVGLCGPQASGKTTGVAILQRLLERSGFAVAAFSIDDLYLTRAGRMTLAEEVHALFATRGPPGTHDIALCNAVFDDLLAGRPTAIPVFDKARDDRAPRGAWRRCEGPVDIVLFEGWCVGAAPQPEARLEAPVNALEREEDPEGVWRRHVNAALAGPYRALFDRFDLLIQLRAPDFSVIPRWRREQEAKLRARTGGGDRTMSDAEVARFVAHDERISRWIDEEMPGRADILIALDEDRNAVSMRLRPGGRLDGA